MVCVTQTWLTRPDFLHFDPQKGTFYRPLTVVGGFSERLYEKHIDDDSNKKDIDIIIVKVLEEKVPKIIDLGKPTNE